MSGKIVIFGNGVLTAKERYIPYLANKPFIICVNGGTKNALFTGATIDLIIGDLDSIPDEIFKELKERGIPFKIFPKEKDLSDLEAALDQAFLRDPDSIILAGVLGMRIDHTLVNINLLEKCLKKGIPCKIVSDEEEILLINESTRIHGKPGQFVSFIPITSEVRDITLKGFRHPLNKESLYRCSSRGLSNEFIGSDASIEVGDGLLLIVIN